MSRYGEALGVMEFSVGGLDFKIRPSHGDNLELLEIKNKSGEDTFKLMKLFVPFATKIIAKEDDLSGDDVSELELFIEHNVMDMLSEFFIAYKWTTREKMEEAEKAQLEGFQAAAMKEN